MSKNCYEMDCIRYPDEGCSPCCEEQDLGHCNWPPCTPIEDDSDSCDHSCRHDCCQHDCHDHDDYQNQDHHDGHCINNISVCPSSSESPHSESSKEDVFAQILDPNISVSLCETGPIPLCTADSTILQRGGFHISKNDTLHFPDIGVYLITINLGYSFLPPTTIDIGQSYEIVVEIRSKNISNYLPCLSIGTGITTTSTISGNLTQTVLVNVTESSSSIHLNLTKFDFSLSFNQALAFTPTINVTKLSHKPL